MTDIRLVVSGANLTVLKRLLHLKQGNQFCYEDARKALLLLSNASLQGFGKLLYARRKAQFDKLYLGQYVPHCSTRMILTP